MKKTYQFRIYPNKKQEVKLNRTLTTCRYTYNEALSERKRQAELNRLKKDFDVFPWGKPEWINYYDQANDLSGSKTDFQKETHSQVLQNVLKRVDRSFMNFFNGFGYPRFQGKDRYNSFTYPQAGFGLDSGKLNLSKIGNIKIILHREIEGPIISVEIKTETGIDVGLASLITMSNGQQIEPPEFLGESEDKLTQEQKRLSRKKKGSGKRNRQRIIISKVHRKIRNQRKDFAHKTSKKLVDTYDRIVFEDLQIQNMVQNHHLAKSISDAGWYQLMILTKSKAEYAGKIVEFVNARNTSKDCP